MPISLMFVSLLWFYYMYLHVYFWWVQLASNATKSVMEPIIFINKIMNLCLHLCSECFLGKLKKVVNTFNPFIFLMSHRLSAVQIKVLVLSSWQVIHVILGTGNVQLYMQHTIMYNCTCNRIISMCNQMMMCVLSKS